MQVGLLSNMVRYTSIARPRPTSTGYIMNMVSETMKNKKTRNKTRKKQNQASLSNQKSKRNNFQLQKENLNFSSVLGIFHSKLKLMVNTIFLNLF